MFLVGLDYDSAVRTRGTRASMEAHSSWAFVGHTAYLSNRNIDSAAGQHNPETDRHTNVWSDIHAMG